MPANSYFTDSPIQPTPEHPGWVRFLDLEAHFQRFLIEAMSEFGCQAEELAGEVYIPTEFVHRFTEHDFDSSRSGGYGELSLHDLHGWYPFDKLSPFGQIFMIATTTNPRHLGVFAGKLFIEKNELVHYIAGEDEEVNNWPSEADLRALIKPVPDRV